MDTLEQKIAEMEKKVAELEQTVRPEVIAEKIIESVKEAFRNFLEVKERSPEIWLRSKTTTPA